MQKRHTIVAVIVLISLFISGCASGVSGSELNEEVQIGIITYAPIQSYASIYAEKLEEQSKKKRTNVRPCCNHKLWLTAFQQLRGGE